MNYSKVVAILNITDYSLVSQQLEQLNIPGVSISTVHGYGDYYNAYAQFGFSENMKIEVYTEEHQAEAIADQLAQLGNELTEGGGVIAIEPVAKLLNVRKLQGSAG